MDAPDQERGGAAEDGEGGEQEVELGLLGAEEGPQRPQTAARRHREYAERHPAALTGHFLWDVLPASDGASEETGQTLRGEHELYIRTGSCPVRPEYSGG